MSGKYIRVENAIHMLESTGTLCGFGKYLLSRVWDSTIKYPYHPRYGWAANHWVFVIEFERCEKLERGREL